MRKKLGHDLSFVEWGPPQISIFLLRPRVRRSVKQKGERKREREAKGNNFPRPTWLRFIIYDLGNNPRRRIERKGGPRAEGRGKSVSVCV